MSETRKAIRNTLKDEARQTLSKVGQIVIGTAYFDLKDNLGYLDIEGRPILYASLAHQYKVEGTVNVKVNNPDGTFSYLKRVPVPQPSTAFSLLPGKINVDDKVTVWYISENVVEIAPLAFGSSIERKHRFKRARDLPKNVNTDQGLIY